MLKVPYKATSSVFTNLYIPRKRYASLNIHTVSHGDVLQRIQTDNITITNRLLTET